MSQTNGRHSSDAAIIAWEILMILVFATFLLAYFAYDAFSTATPFWRVTGVVGTIVVAWISVPSVLYWVYRFAVWVRDIAELVSGYRDDDLVLVEKEEVSDR